MISTANLFESQIHQNMNYREPMKWRHNSDWPKVGKVLTEKDEIIPLQWKQVSATQLPGPGTCAHVQLPNKEADDENGIPVQQ